LVSTADGAAWCERGVSQTRGRGGWPQSEMAASERGLLQWSKRTHARANPSHAPQSARQRYDNSPLPYCPCSPSLRGVGITLFHVCAVCVTVRLRWPSVCGEIYVLSMTLIILVPGSCSLSRVLISRRRRMVCPSRWCRTVCSSRDARLRGCQRIRLHLCCGNCWWSTRLHWRLQASVATPPTTAWRRCGCPTLPCQRIGSYVRACRVGAVLCTGSRRVDRTCTRVRMFSSHHSPWRLPPPARRPSARAAGYHELGGHCHHSRRSYS
jgi:hypothetical protein